MCSYVDECENKRRILEINTKDSKFIIAGIIGVLAFIPSTIASNNLFPDLQLLTFPATTIMANVVLTTIGVGYIGQLIITSFFKKKMNKITDAKTDDEILEQMMHYEMEIDKSENKKNALRKMYKMVESKQQILSDYSADFSQIDKYETLTNNDLKNRREMVTKAYKDRLIQLDVLTSQAYLKNKFQWYRKKFDRVEKIITGALYVFLFFALFIGVPMLVELGEASTLGTLAEMAKQLGIAVTPALAGAILSIPYLYKRNKNNLRVFKNLNEALGENALSLKPNKEYENELNNMISAKLCEVVELGMELHEIDNAIEKRFAVTDDQSQELDSKKAVLYKNYPALNITEETILANKNGKVYTDGEWEKRSQSVLATPLPGGGDKSSLIRKRTLPKSKDN